MKNKFVKWGLIILGIIALGFVIWKIVSYKEQPFKKIEMEGTNTILNGTDMKYIDTIVYAGLQVLNIDTTVVIIRNLDPGFRPSSMDGYDLKAYIKTNGLQYVIWVSDLNKVNAIETLSHELIHMKQYYDQKLVINKDTVIWNGGIFETMNVKYEQYPWEIEAFKNQNDLAKKMKSILYEEK